jgi:hypothetical protein
MRADKWAGLVTNASPYAIPPGAAVEQLNLATNIPGQLTSRNGMRPVAFSSPAEVPEVLDLYPYATSSGVILVALKANGEVIALQSPAYGTALSSPLDPELSPSSGQVVSSYTGKFYDYNGEPPS